jgi:hypothetical protein
MYEPFTALAGARAAIHTASARLFVFSTADVGRAPMPSPDVAVRGEGPAAYAPVGRADADADEGRDDREEPAQTEEELTPSTSDRSATER